MEKILFRNFDVCENPMTKLLEDTTQDHVVKYIKRVLDFRPIYCMNNTLTHRYNQRMVRFVKSELLSRTVQRASREKIVYVNETGYDFFLPELDIKIEFKSGINIFGRPSSANTATMTLDNTNGQDSRKKVYTKKFDYLLLIDVNRSGIIKYEDIQPFIKCTGDGRRITLPKSKIETITQSTEVFSDKKIYIDDRIDQAMNQMIDEVFQICENHE
jgi:hypothetical protein